MRTGAPAFGTPESVIGILAGAQIARRYGLPFRGGGGLASANAVDARPPPRRDDAVGDDAGWHRLGAARGRLARGRAWASYEKFALDLELLDQFRSAGGHRRSPRRSSPSTPWRERPGRAVPGLPHTLEHFKEWLYMSPLFQTPDFADVGIMGSDGDRPGANGRGSSCSRAYEDPGLDPAIERNSGLHREAEARSPRTRGLTPRSSGHPFRFGRPSADEGGERARGGSDTEGECSICVARPFRSSSFLLQSEQLS